MKPFVLALLCVACSEPFVTAAGSPDSIPGGPDGGALDAPPGPLATGGRVSQGSSSGGGAASGGRPGSGGALGGSSGAGGAETGGSPDTGGAPGAGDAAAPDAGPCHVCSLGRCCVAGEVCDQFFGCRRG